MFKERDMDERLYLIASMVRKDSLLADVGCDHGILITYLLDKGIIKGGVATDINKMPLDKAVFRVKSLKMEDKISLRLSDGLSLVNEDEADDIVIAGMGGELIFKIITDCKWSKNKGKRFILNPMTKSPFLRASMAQEGFTLLEEKACVANNKHYSVMKYEYTGEEKYYNEFDPFPYIGLLTENLDKSAKEYIEGKVSMVLKKAEGLKASDKDISDRYFKLAKDLKRKGEI